VADVKSNPDHLRIVEEWMRSYRPEELFDQEGALVPELRDLPPVGERRMSANPHANGGKLRKALKLPNFRDYAIPIDSAGRKEVSPTETLGKFVRDVMRRNMNSFRLFSPDENASNRLQDVYQASPKTWLAEIKPEDADGTDIAPDGRVMEMLSEHTLEGWLEGYIQRDATGSLILTRHSSMSLTPCTTSMRSGWRNQKPSLTGGPLSPPLTS
jgi:xylulose-5-phosphate/fructose-6-phosphate phosphoketolase